MLFNSLTYAIFFPVIFAVYWAIASQKPRIRQGFILLASYFFYGSWDWRFLILIVLSSLTDFLVGQKIYDSSDPKARKRWLLLSLLMNLGLLGVFKYFNFFVSSFLDFSTFFGLNANVETLEIILPVGISFYTFQTLSYTIDIYRKKLKPTREWLPFFAFVAFFPQLVAGPIERASHLLPQFFKKPVFNKKKAVSGLELILWGLFKKIVIADGLARIVNPVYALDGEFSGLAVIIGTLGFAFQIYCDFSGYSDVAIGSARLLGFDLMTNFRKPYFATSIQNFWARWHISLSTWFRDYVYIPLGGNRSSAPRWMLNIFLTFVISGFWHGANYTFIIWGAIHGITYLIEALFRRNENILKKVPNPLSWGMTFIVVNIAWVFFRAENVSQATNLLGRINDNLFSQVAAFGSFFTDFFTQTTSPIEGFYLFISIVLFLLIEWATETDRIKSLWANLPVWGRWIGYYIIIVWIWLFGAFAEPQQFIYFQF